MTKNDQILKSCVSRDKIRSLCVGKALEDEIPSNYVGQSDASCADPLFARLDDARLDAAAE
eukprot:2510461-Pyramimonas_sp.AAC.1